MPAIGGLYSITGLAPAPIEYTAAGYWLSLSDGIGSYQLIVDDIASGAAMTLNTGPGDNTVESLCFRDRRVRRFPSTAARTIFP